MAGVGSVTSDGSSFDLRPSPRPTNKFRRRLSTKSEADRKTAAFIKDRFKKKKGTQHQLLVSESSTGSSACRHVEDTDTVSHGEIEFKGTKRRSKAQVNQSTNISNSRFKPLKPNDN